MGGMSLPSFKPYRKPTTTGSSGPKPVVIGGVTYTPTEMPGVYISPWGQYGYLEEKPSSIIGDPPTQSFQAIDKRFLEGAGAGADMRPREFDDPRYWDIQYQKLYNEALNSGLDAETARRQALATLIASRNNLSADVANTSANVAKTAADFAANPRDAYAEAIYRNQVGGGTPFGDVNNSAFGEYGKALADKASSIFQPVSQDLNFARQYRDSIPRPEFLEPAPAIAPLLGGAPAPAAAPAGEPNGLKMLVDQLNSFSPQQQEDFRKYVTGGAYQPDTTVPKFDMGGIINSRPAVGHSPTSSEGGLNMNIFEPWVAVGMDSGKVLFTGSEPRPDGSRRGEQVVIKPLKSETEKDKKLAEGNKAVTQSFGVPKAAEGGTVTSGPTPDDLFEQFNQLLTRLGGEGGGSSTPFQGTRFLAGAPANAILEDPFLKGITEGTYSMKGVSPDQLWADIAKFTPKSSLYQNRPQVNFAG